MPRSKTTGRYVRARRASPRRSRPASSRRFVPRAERAGEELAGVVTGPTIQLGAEAEPERPTRRASAAKDE